MNTVFKFSYLGNKVLDLVQSMNKQCQNCLSSRFTDFFNQGSPKNPGFYKNENENFILLKMNKNEIQKFWET